MKALDGKVAIVTGGNRGIGRAIAERLARDGTRVVVCARDAAALTDTVRSIGDNASMIALDLRDRASARLLVEFALTRFGAIDILVNNAGATKRGNFVSLTDDDWVDGFALKLFGAVRVTRECWPELKRRGGSVVNVAGVGGRTPGAQFTIGGSVNAAMLSFTKALAELGVDDGVQVNAVNPGPVRTARFDRRIAAEAAASGLSREAAEARFVLREKITRVGEPGDVANLVAFLVGPEGRFVHGSLVDVDGGSTKAI